MTIYAGTVQLMPIGQNRRRLLKDYNVEINGVRYTIPAGFEWDGASVPKLFWSRFGHPFDDIHLEPGLWHDAAYSGLFKDVTREKADDIYYAWIRGNGQSFIKAKLEYRAIRWFGGSHWSETNYVKTEESKYGREVDTMDLVSIVMVAVFIGIGGCASIDAGLAKIFRDEPAIIISAQSLTDKP